jgi:hypothetical protein
MQFHCFVRIKQEIFAAVACLIQSKADRLRVPAAASQQKCRIASEMHFFVLIENSEHFVAFSCMATNELQFTFKFGRIN